MKPYVVVMWLGPKDERGVFVKGKDVQSVLDMVHKRRWKGRLVQIIPVVEPGNSVYDQIVGTTLKIVEGGKQ